MNNILKYIFGVTAIIGALAMTVSSVLFGVNLHAATDTMDSKIISVAINNQAYVYGTSSVQHLLTDEVFAFKVVLENTGTTVWGTGEGQHGFSLLSRGDATRDTDDYNETFGTFFIVNPIQHPEVITSGEQFTYDTVLKAPSDPGHYFMRWQTADWTVGQNYGYHISTTNPSLYASPYNYFNREFFGQEIIVELEIDERTEESPYAERKPGVIDQHDFTYVGSYELPSIPSGAGGTIDKSYIDSPIEIRKVENSEGKTELRMLAMAGTYQSTLYEVLLPDILGKIEGTDKSAVQTATLTKVFESEIPLRNVGMGSEGWAQGDMWLDTDTDTLYWSNFPNYPASGNVSAPNVYYASIDYENGLLYDAKEWYRPSGSSIPKIPFYGGVARIPDQIANEYFDGRTLALGFGGGGSIISSRSLGPAFAVISLDESGDLNDESFAPVMYYPINTSTGATHCVRNGNYFSLSNYDPNPTSPWGGRFISGDKVQSGVFIDYAGKKGYMTFASLCTGRRAYDLAGSVQFAKPSEQAWYFYDFETLGQAFETGNCTGLTPSSFNTVKYPVYSNDFSGAVSGSYFDNETGLLYLYVKNSNRTGTYTNDPFIHVYKVSESDEFSPYISGGSSTLNLVKGYNSTKTAAFNIMGLPEPSVSLQSTPSAPQITWNNVARKIEIAEGLPVGTYSVVITAENNVGIKNFTFTLTVTSAPDIPPGDNPPGGGKKGFFAKIPPGVYIGISVGGGVLLVVGIIGWLVRRKRMA